MNIEWILFDWGGTLADVSRQPEALVQGARAAGRILTGVSDDDVIATLAQGALLAERNAASDPEHREVDLRAFLAAWAEAQGCPAGEDQIAAAVRAVCESWVGGSLDPLPGALDAVRGLRDRGYRMGLVSNCWIPPAYCRQELDRQGFGELLDFAVFSSELSVRKPSPVIYRASLKKAYPIGVPADLSRVLFVGDSPICDVIAPAQMGMKTALVASEPGTWPQADHDRARPDLRINAVTQLGSLLEGG